MAFARPQVLYVCPLLHPKTRELLGVMEAHNGVQAPTLVRVGVWAVRCVRQYSVSGRTMRRPAVTLDALFFWQSLWPSSPLLDDPEDYPAASLSDHTVAALSTMAQFASTALAQLAAAGAFTQGYGVPACTRVHLTSLLQTLPRLPGLLAVFVCLRIALQLTPTIQRRHQNCTIRVLDTRAAVCCTRDTPQLHQTSDHRSSPSPLPLRLRTRNDTPVLRM